MTEVSQDFSLGWIAGVAILSALRAVTPSKTVCNVAQNPLTQVGEAVGTAVVSVFTGGGGIGASQAIKIAFVQTLKSLLKSVPLAIGFEMLQEILLKSVIDLAAGTVVDENTFGERAGDALVSGSSALMARTGSGSGAPPLTPSQASDYNKIEMKQVRVAAAQEDQLTLSPFDISSPYTALGSIANGFAPYMSSFDTLTGGLQAISSISLSTIANMSTPRIYAEDAADNEDFTCQDPELNDLKIGCYQTLATTTGLPLKVMEDFNKGIPGATLDDIANRLRNHTVVFRANHSKVPGICERNRGEIWDRNPLDGPAYPVCSDPLINEDGQLESPLSLIYENFVARCILRTNPIGYGDETEGDGRDCVINDTATWESDYSNMNMEDELQYTSGEEGMRLPNQMKVDMYLWWQAMRSFCVDTYGFDNSNTDNEDGKPCQAQFYDSAYITPFTHQREFGYPFIPATGETGPPENASQNLPSSTSTPPSSSGSGINVVSGSDQQLAAKILANPNIDIVPRYKYQFEAYAKGDSSCHISSDILKLIATLGETRKLQVYSLNRHCTKVFTSVTSFHEANGGGNAVDFSYVDGYKATGANPRDIKVYNDAMLILPDKKLQHGQINCRPRGSLSIPPGNKSVEIEDDCNHIHIGIYP